MSFAIAVLSYNHPDLTARCLNSILALPGIQPEQIFLAHNGSLTKHQSSLITAFPRLHHVVLEDNKGFSGGANALLNKSLTDFKWLFFITNDCELLSLNSPPQEEGIYAPQILLRKTDRVDSLGGEIKLGHLSLRHCKSESEFSAAAVKYIPGSAFWISRDVFNLLRGFDESFGTYWEDVDLSYRATLMGINLGLDPSTQLRHGGSKTTGKLKDYTLFYFQKNRLRFFSKHRLWTLQRRLIYGLDLIRLCLRLLRQGRGNDALTLLKHLISPK